MFNVIGYTLLVIMYFIYGYYIFLWIKENKQKNLPKARCGICNHILSEWFKDTPYMFCYECETTSKWKSHKEYREILK